ncbi:hypothetical protein ERJ75_000539700 [Trypanosoma vivax]|nr:hypothetical protein ERJ75_000539700 [Trypanosoma vivax]
MLLVVACALYLSSLTAPTPKLTAVSFPSQTEHAARAEFLQACVRVRVCAVSVARLSPAAWRASDPCVRCVARRAFRSSPVRTAAHSSLSPGVLVCRQKEVSVASARGTQVPGERTVLRFEEGLFSVWGEGSA